MRNTAVWRSPSAIGIGTAVVVHLLLAFTFVVITVTVRPMSAPPMEVELLAGDVSAAREGSPATPSPPLAASIREHEGDILPLPSRSPEDDVMPELPGASFSEPALVPSTSRAPEHAAGHSPRARLAPVPVTADTTRGAAGVRVRVEGTLSTRRLVHLVDPVFPSGAPSGGTVLVRLVVKPDGIVTLATLIRKAHPMLDEAALDALRQWRFAASQDTVQAFGIVTVEFVLR